ncbi:phosphoesterase PA-phosphatase-like protein [Sphingobium cloacae]|uniref:Phosphoesterase PA-phosphatase-like protein n=1 Tax=Sphingobium cloacae TaxID=120107 RepID=A0A1E1F006_9SPHN|nr:phosphoesterase PA-phosphatase-like protein [Sphingobium cloacae]
MALALLCVLAIALLQRQGLLDFLNEGLMRRAGEWRHDPVGRHLTAGMQAASVIGGTTARLILLAAAAVLLWRKARGRALWLALTVAGGALLNALLKQIFTAPRPDLLPHLDIVHSYSFPSGHAAGNMIFFGALALLAGRWPIYAIAALVIMWIGGSRVWLGVHWPSDVIAGWIEGVGWLAFCACWIPGTDRSA